MRRNHPPVKRCRGALGAFCGHQFGVHAVAQYSTNRGRLPTPTVSLCARVSTPAPSRVAARVRWSIEPAFQQPSRPARCNSPRPATRVRPCPGFGGGQGPIIVIEPGPSVGLCPNEPRTAVGALAPSLPNSAPELSALEASSARSRRTGARLFRWPYRLLRRQPAPSPLWEDSSLGDLSAEGDPNRGSCTSGTGACGSDCGATSDAHSADTVAPEGSSYAGTLCDLDRPRRQVSLWEQRLSS